ncbi:MAG: tryptophan--tRNA ligase, partial [Anaerolineales bacterium]
TQYKDKAKNKKESVSVGVFDYPVLMAADILLYQTDFVPVGDDQKQHVELTRDIAQRFNAIYGETFNIPEPSIARVGARIMGLDDATKKMSKSDPNAGHAIHLLDTADIIRSKFKRARTDSSSEIRFDASRPEVYNLLVIYELVTGLSRPEIEAQFDGKGYAVFKKALAEAVIAFLGPLQSRYAALQEDPAQLDSLLAEGAAKARPIAEKTLKQVKEKIGLR